MKNYLRRMISFLIVFCLVLVMVGNTVAQTGSSKQIPDMGLINLINTMDLPKAQFNQTLKLTKQFMSKIQHSDSAITKILSTKNNNLLVSPGQFEKTVIIQRHFLEKMKQYHTALEKVIGPDKANRIFDKTYYIIPIYLLPGKMGTDSTTLNNHLVTDGETPPGMETKIETEKMNGKYGWMGVIGPPMNPNPMFNTNRDQSMNGNKQDIVKQQTLLQLHTSNAMLIQLLNVLSNEPAVGKVQTQIQTIKQILINQSALIQMLIADSSTGSLNTGQNNSVENGNSGNMK